MKKETRQRLSSLLLVALMLFASLASRTAHAEETLLKGEGSTVNEETFQSTMDADLQSRTARSAILKLNTYQVSFDLMGVSAEAIDVQEVAEGDKAIRPDDPVTEETDFTFAGWYKNAVCTEAWDFDTDTVTQDTVIYAKWTHEHDGITFIAYNKKDRPVKGNYVLSEDIQTNLMWEFYSPNDINLCLHGHEIYYAHESYVQSYAIEVYKGVTLSLYDCQTVPGNIRAMEGSGIYVGPGATLNMYNGSVSHNRKMSNSPTSGYGVITYENSNGDGIFNMYGGVIGDNDNTGVYLWGGGIFNMHGGTISGNGLVNACHGGGVHIMGGGTMNMSAGTITGNSVQATSNHRGGGVQVESGKFHIVEAENGMTGIINITGNKNYSGWTGNVDVCNKPIYVEAQLSADSKIGVWTSATPNAQIPDQFEVVLTDGLLNNGTLDHFQSDMPYHRDMDDNYFPYKLTINDDGELVLRQVFLVDFDANGGTGEMETQEFIAGYNPLPECTFTPPEGMVFDVWTSTIGVGGPAGTPAFIDRDLTDFTILQATWKEAPVSNHTVTFVSPKTAVPETQTVQHGEKATKPASPAFGDEVNDYDETHLLFDAWYTKPASEMASGEANSFKFDFDTPITEDVTLYAAYRGICNAITYDRTYQVRNQGGT
ncbi:MAG: InlB B-repeat-containing protein, partial [Erysipelotrichaceae bacterium]|nr:InlB B-repeat-containing protein [Erysipelotrichaceae bacterium]